MVLCRVGIPVMYLAMAPSGVQNKLMLPLCRNIFGRSLAPNVPFSALTPAVCAETGPGAEEDARGGSDEQGTDLHTVQWHHPVLGREAAGSRLLIPNHPWRHADEATSCCDQRLPM